MKWIVGALGVSLLVNIFIGGLLLGHEFRKPEMRYREPPIDFNLKKFGKHLTKEERQKVRTLIKSRREALSAGYKELRETEHRIIDLIVAEKVDREALQAALREHGVRVQKLHDPLQDVLLEMVAEMDHETRQKLGEDMFKSRRPSKGDHRMRKHFDKEGGAGHHCPPPPDGHGPVPDDGMKPDHE